MEETADPIDRRGITASALAGAALAFLVIAYAANFDVDRATFGDGVLHRYVAEHLTASPAEVTQDLEGHGTALRYGRIVLPVLIWIGSAGRPEAMPYIQPLFMILSAAAIAAAARSLLPRGGRSAVIVPFAAAGLTASLAGGFAEPVAIAFALWAVVWARREQWWIAAGLLALAMLTRENAAGVAIGLVAWYVLRRRPAAAGVLSLSVVPVALWHVFVGVRFRFLPLMDPLLRTTRGAFGPPVLAAWRSLTQTNGSRTVVVAVHLALVLVAFVTCRNSDLAAISAACGLQTLWNGPPQWSYIGDGIRLQVFLEVFVLLSLWSRTRVREKYSPLMLFEPLPEDRREELIHRNVVVGQDL